MQVSTNNFQPTQDTQTSQTTKTSENKSIPQEPPSVYQLIKKTKDFAILNASASVTSQAADQPQHLLFKTAINEINKILEPYLGADSAQQAYDSGLDVTPEATADRIVQGSTAFFNAFKEQHSELNDADVLNEFLSVIGGGIDQGFEEARDILDSLKVLEGKIAEDIDSTYSLVQDGLTKFKDQIMASSDSSQSEVDTSELNKE